MDEYRPSFDERKFRNLILYIAKRGEQDASLGKTKLWKTLWLSDFLAFARLGESITGADYVHMPQGPGPARGDRVLKRLQNEQSVDMEPRLYFGRRMLHPTAKADPEPTATWLTPEQREIVDEAIELFADGNANDASNWAHENSVGWRLTEDGERIPYETIFLSPEQPTAEEAAEGEELARRNGWLERTG